ncbi:MAG: DNA-processing protein DprA [Myxococcota bacterium]
MEKNREKAIYQLGLSTVGKRQDLATQILAGNCDPATVLEEKELQKKFRIDFSGSRETYEQEMEFFNKNNCNFAVLGDMNYPKYLYQLNSPPFICKWIGRMSNKPGICIVGARRAYRKEMELAAALAGKLGEIGYHIISGGAYGVDGAAHRGSFSSKGKTSVFLGGGFYHLYSERYIFLFRKIVKHKGALMSFLPLDLPPHAGTFIQRNKFMAVAAEIVIVIAAGHRSGSLYTAKFARKFGKQLFAVPGTKGCEKLIKEGTVALNSIEDCKKIQEKLHRSY